MAAQSPDPQIHRNRLIPTLAPVFVVLAAGLGTRFGGDKPLARITSAGATLVDFAIFDAVRAGFEGPVIVVRPDGAEAMRDHLESQFGSALRPTLVHQPEPLGTGHALLCAAEHLSRPFAVANADDFYGRPAYELLLRRSSRHSAESCVIVFRLGDTLSAFGGVSRAVCRTDGEGFLTGMTEVLDIRRSGDRIEGLTVRGTAVELTGDESVSTGLWGLGPSFVEHLRSSFERHDEALGEFRLSVATDALIRVGEIRLRALRMPDAGFGITFAEDVEPARNRIAEKIAAGDYPARFGPMAMGPPSTPGADSSEAQES